MAGSTTEDNGGGSSIIEGMTSEQRCLSADSLAEWRSCEQVENGTPSTSPPFWDTDEDDEDKGAKPSVLYGKFTWKIENFSQINKRELRSNTFVVGGYKWYILIYPQGCDVSNHLSLFLCVANHDKLLPGWSHFAQFTIAVVNKDPKKSKYSDTLHRFWKKEHDWGWKKFMELSKVSDGFIVADTLVIKAQVQVIREKANRPFRCLDRHYRRELIRVYLSNVEQICRRFVEERRGKLSKLIEDKMRWSSFRTFWLGVDQISKRRMSRDKSDTILKVVVKHFFIEKEVTSTLVMDSLYSGLKALECQSKNKTERAKLADLEDLPAPMVHVEKDMFVLADDVLLLLERAALEPLPHQVSSPKDDKGPQNRTKDGSSGEESNNDFIERDERCLTELGRRTVEIFVLAHIFSSRIEIAYQEAVALKRQEELIREEEVAGQVESELKAKRSAAEKEKRSKKKQAKQKRNTRKGKDRGKDEKSDLMMQDAPQPENSSDRRLLEDFSSRQAEPVIGKVKTVEYASDVSDTGDDAPEPLQPDLDDKDVSSVKWDQNASKIDSAMDVSGSERQNGQTEKRSLSSVDDSCSIRSTESVPSVAMNGQHKGNSLPYNKSQMSPARGKNQRSRDTHDRTGFTHRGINPSSETTTGAVQLCDATDDCRDSQPEPVPVLSLKDDKQILEKHLVEKEDVAAVPKKLNVKDQGEVERPPNSRTIESSSAPTSLGKKSQFGPQLSKQSVEIRTTSATMSEIISSKQLPSITPAQTDKNAPPATESQLSYSSNSETQKLAMSSSRTATHPVPAVSRPLSAPLIPSPRPTVPIVSTSQAAAPLLSRSVSAAGRLGADPSLSAPSYVPQSYRNAIVGKTSTGACPAGFPPVSSASSSQPVSYCQSPAYPSSVSMLPPQSSARNGPTPLRPGFTFGSVKPETLHSQHLWNDDRYSYQEASTTLYRSNLASDISRLDIYGRSREKLYSGEVSACSPSGQMQGAVSEEFPHLAIINDLLDEDQSISKALNGQHHPFSPQYNFIPDATTADTGSLGDPCRFVQNEQYYGENFQRVYGPFHGVRDSHLEQMELSAYANGHIDGAIQSHWPYHLADPSLLNLAGADANGYSYQVQDYLNSTSGENGGYNMYRSSGGI